MKFLRPWPIYNGARLYMWRFYLIDTPFGGVCINRIHAADGDRHLHDHPYSFLSIVLRGDYSEEVFGPASTRIQRWVRWFNFKPAGMAGAHRISHIWRKPVTTLVFYGPRRITWGFYIDDEEPNRWRWMFWRDYLHVKENQQANPAAGESKA